MSFMSPRLTPQQQANNAMLKDYDLSTKREKAIVEEMNKLVEQGKKEAGLFGKGKKEPGTLTYEDAGYVASGRDISNDKLSKKMQDIGNQAKPPSEGSDNLDAEIRKSGYKEFMSKCPGCGAEVRASQEFCSQICSSNFLADEIKYRGSKASASTKLPTFDDIRYGRAPLSDRKIALNKARAKAKAEALAG